MFASTEMWTRFSPLFKKYLRPCIHRMFPCAAVTRPDDAGRNHTPWLNFVTLLSKSKLDKRLKYTSEMCLIHQFFMPFHIHVIQFRYDFLSSIIVWYTFECIKVYLIHIWVHQNCIKSESNQGVQFSSVQKRIEIQPGQLHNNTMIPPLID